MKRIVARIILFVVGLGLAAAASFGQSPDRRGEVAIDRDSYQGVAANAHLPARYHVRNEGGSDGAGLCVISSVLANGMSQGVPGLDLAGHDERSGGNMPGKGSALWRTAKSRPGGYDPDKLQHLIRETVPDEPYMSYVGTDPGVLDKLSAEGYPIGSTMNTGQLYNYAPIHHMISLAHFDASYACVVDNNDPGKYHWMPRAEYLRRWIDGGVGWAFVWLRRGGDDFLFALLMLAASILMLGRLRASPRKATR